MFANSVHRPDNETESVVDSTSTFLGGTRMRGSSRDKLNSTHLVGSIGIAAIIAVLTSSWALFLLVSIALIVASIGTGEIRFDRSNKKK